MRTIQTAISNMLVEDTGINMCDSGGIDNKQWQQNQKVKSFDERPVIDVEVYDTDDIIIYYDIYHYLTNFLSVTNKSEDLNDMLQDIVESERFDSYYQNINELIAYQETDTIQNINTYNYDNVLSGVLQYKIIEIEDDYGSDTFIILQIHTGADVRGGYTRPQVFEIDDLDYFMMAQTEINAYCECRSWSSDECGYNWYINKNQSEFNDASCSDNGILICNRCGKEIQFSVIEEY